MLGETLGAALGRIKESGAEFYVYVLRRPDGTPFYVGKGHIGRRRMAIHEEHARTKRRSRKLSIIRGIWKSGGAVGYEIAGTFQSESDALAEEVRLIAEIGRHDTGAGPLANVTDGGEGVIGLRHSPEARAKMRAANLRRIDDIAEKFQERRNSADFVAARRAAEPKRIEKVIAHQRTPEARKARSVTMKALLRNDDVLLAARRAQLAAIRDTPGNAENMAAATREYWADPEHRAKRTAALSDAAKRPETKAKQAASRAARWARPGERERHSEVMRAANERRRALKLGELAASG